MCLSVCLAAWCPVPVTLSLVPLVPLVFTIRADVRVLDYNTVTVSSFRCWDTVREAHFEVTGYVLSISPLLKGRSRQEVGCGLGVVGWLLVPGSQGLLCFAVPSCLPAGPVMTGSCSLNPMCWKAKCRLLGLVWAGHLCGESLWLLNRGLRKLRDSRVTFQVQFYLGTS